MRQNFNTFWCRHLLWLLLSSSSFPVRAKSLSGVLATFKLKRSPYTFWLQYTSTTLISNQKRPPKFKMIWHKIVQVKKSTIYCVSYLVEDRLTLSNAHDKWAQKTIFSSCSRIYLSLLKEIIILYIHILKRRVDL